MKCMCTALSLLALMLCVGSASARTWTSVDGRKVDADFAGFVDHKAELIRNDDGRHFLIPMYKLSRPDRHYLEQLRQKEVARQRLQAKMEKQQAASAPHPTGLTKGFLNSFGGMICTLGVLVAVIAQLWFIVAAFTSGMVWDTVVTTTGPFGDLLYAMSNWEEAKWPLSVAVLGLAICLLGGYFSIGAFV